jgi:phage host-nuclease inhibitor protein Gam
VAHRKHLGCRLGHVPGGRAGGTGRERGRAAKARIDKRAAELTARAERGAAFFRYRLAEYAHAQRAFLLGGGKKKSRELVGGTLGWRSRSGRLVVEDEAALNAWLERQPVESGLYTVRVKAVMAALNAYFAGTNEIPPGCIWDPGGETFYVKVQPPATEGLEVKHG